MDGDHVHASFWKKLVDLMRATQAAVERLASLRWRLEEDIIGSMTEPATAWGDGDVEARGRAPKRCASRMCCCTWCVRFFVVCCRLSLSDVRL